MPNYMLVSSTIMPVVAMIDAFRPSDVTKINGQNTKRLPYIEIYKSAQLDMLEHPYSYINHNIISNDRCDGLKIMQIGQSAGNSPNQQRINPHRLSSDGVKVKIPNLEVSCISKKKRDEDIVKTLQKYKELDIIGLSK